MAPPPVRYSRRLPIGTFFAYSSILIGILAVVLAGKGISGLQEAGLLDITPLPNLPRIPILGIAPALEPVAAFSWLMHAVHQETRQVVGVGRMYGAPHPERGGCTTAAAPQAWCGCGVWPARAAARGR